MIMALDKIWLQAGLPIDMFMKNNAKFDIANPRNYRKVYKFPVRPTR